jgi:hypothetical protein
MSFVVFQRSGYCEQSFLFFSFGVSHWNFVAKIVEIFAISCLFNRSSILASDIFAYFVNPLSYAHLYASNNSWLEFTLPVLLAHFHGTTDFGSALTSLAGVVGSFSTDFTSVVLGHDHFDDGLEEPPHPLYPFDGLFSVQWAVNVLSHTIVYNIDTLLFPSYHPAKLYHVLVGLGN